MIIKRSITAIASTLLFAGLISAQEGTINLEQDPRIAQLVEVYKSVNSKVDYYQIQVGFKTKDSDAQRLLNQVEVEFPGWFSEIRFQEPTYRVRLGKFRDPLEAERKYIEVRKKYPNAMLLKPEQSTK
ncbi:SPOR domain-containing protein [Croceitalea sp. MTPC5]|uniref:SPOR domain-containing protein n=1 Tax=Croceitalea sp. MTPC5 TaxID=3056565 RepID=UPI002B3AF5C1|nr:SPOR domain-containing protein [Croceitalea sp. MTPC5]